MAQALFAAADRLARRRIRGSSATRLWQVLQEARENFRVGRTISNMEWFGAKILLRASGFAILHGLGEFEPKSRSKPEEAKPR
jgi:hypothetical protein